MVVREQDCYSLNYFLSWILDKFMLEPRVYSPFRRLQRDRNEIEDA